jgi:hypothetical protein
VYVLSGLFGIVPNLLIFSVGSVREELDQVLKLQLVISVIDCKYGIKSYMLRTSVNVSCKS